MQVRTILATMEPDLTYTTGEGDERIVEIKGPHGDRRRRPVKKKKKGMQP